MRICLLELQSARPAVGGRGQGMGMAYVSVIELTATIGNAAGRGAAAAWELAMGLKRLG